MQIVHARAFTHEQQMGELIAVRLLMLPASDVQHHKLFVQNLAQNLLLSTELLTPLVAKMVEEPFKLLIMDSITANLRVDFSGRGELAERCACVLLPRLCKLWLMLLTPVMDQEVHSAGEK